MGPIKGIKKRKRAEKKVDQNVVAAAMAASGLCNQKQPSDWWHEFSNRISGPLSCSSDSLTFESVFKISRKTFDYICSLVKEDLMSRPTNFFDLSGKTLSLNDQVAVALRRLSSGESLSTIGESFGMNQSTVSQITWRFVESMEERGLKHLGWPSIGSEIDRIKSKFEKIGGLPNCCGAVDITHIIMTLPTMEPSNRVWLDREKNYSMILQAIVDPKMRFLDVLAGWPGSLSDTMALKNSGFFKLSEEGKRLNGKRMKLSGETELREYIIGDSGFPLLPWLLTPYRAKPMSERQAEFNKRHLATRLVAEMALAKLKETWRIIHGVMWMPDKNKLPRIVLVCCLLHNIVIDMKDEVSCRKTLSHEHDTSYRQQKSKYMDEVASNMRDKLSLYLSGKLSS